MTATKKTASPPAKPGPKGGIGNVIGLIVVGLISVLALWGLFGQGSPESTARPIPASQTLRPISAQPAPVRATVPGQAPTRSGQPWEYDAAADYHYDPRPGHEHWHQGQPPPEDQRGDAVAAAGAPTITPVTTTPIQVNANDGRPDRDGGPWEYDLESGFHWDPRPGHEHWHRGEPPAEDKR